MPQDVDPPKPVARVFKNFMPAKNKNGKTVYVPRGTDLFLVQNYPDDYNFIGSNHDLQETILIEVANGKTVTKVAEELDLPFSIILDHSRRNEDFRERLNEARTYRAEHYHDKFANIAETVDESSSKSSKVKTEIYRHLMAVGDRDRFGAQQKIVGDPNHPVSFIVDTGIRRIEAPESIPAEGQTIDEIPSGDRPEPAEWVSPQRKARLQARADLDGVSAEASATTDPLAAQEI